MHHTRSSSTQNLNIQLQSSQVLNYKRHSIVKKQSTILKNQNNKFQQDYLKKQIGHVEAINFTKRQDFNPFNPYKAYSTSKIEYSQMKQSGKNQNNLSKNQIKLFQRNPVKSNYNQSHDNFYLTSPNFNSNSNYNIYNNNENSVTNISTKNIENDSVCFENKSKILKSAQSTNIEQQSPHSFKIENFNDSIQNDEENFQQNQNNCDQNKQKSIAQIRKQMQRKLQKEYYDELFKYKQQPVTYFFDQKKLEKNEIIYLNLLKAQQQQNLKEEEKFMEFMQAIDNIREKSESVQVNMEEDINKIHHEFIQLKNSSQFKKIYKSELEKQSTSKMDFMIYQAEQFKDEEKRRKFFMQLIQLYPEKNIIKHVKNHNQTKSIKKAVSELKEYKKLKDKPTKYLFNKEKSVDALAKPLMMPQKFKVRHVDTKTQIDFKKPVEIQFFNYEQDDSPLKNQQKNSKKKGQLSAYDLEKQLKEIQKNHEKDLKEQQNKVDYIYHLKQQYQKKLEKEQEQIEQEYRIQQQIQEKIQKQKQKQRQKDDGSLIPNKNKEKTEEDEENQEQQIQQQKQEEETESEEENDKNQDQDKKLVTWDKYGFFVQQKQYTIPVQRKVKRIFFEDIKKQYLEKRKLQSAQLGDLYEQDKTHDNAKFQSNQDKAAKNLLNKYQANKQNLNQLSSNGSDLNIQEKNNFNMSNQTSQKSIQKQSLLLNKLNNQQNQNKMSLILEDLNPKIQNLEKNNLKEEIDQTQNQYKRISQNFYN